MNKQYGYKGAFAQVDITPAYPTTLIGRYRPEPAQGVLHRLYAQALLLQANSDIYCLVAVDSLGLTVPLARTIRTQVAALLHTDISHIMLNFSHTHSAPDPTPSGLNGERYFDFLRQQIINCVKTAMGSFRPCKADWSLAAIDIGENRREGGMALDRRLGGLMITERDGGKPIVLVVRMAAHANILPGENLHVSSDFIGIAREELQGFYGFPVMVLQGASGNIKAAGTNDIGEGDGPILRAIADGLVRGVMGLRFAPKDIADVQMFSAELTGVADVPIKEGAEQIAAGYPRFVTEDWLRACEVLREQGIKTQQAPIEVNFFLLNEGCICGVAEEIFCELALDAQARTGNPLLFLDGYTNGCMGYLPSRAEWSKGGYEVVDSYFVYFKYTGHVAPYRAETADRIVDLVVREWERKQKVNCN